MRMVANICQTTKQKKLMIWASGCKNLWHFVECTRIVLLTAKGLTEVKSARRIKTRQSMMVQWSWRFEDQGLLEKKKECFRGRSCGPCPSTKFKCRSSALERHFQH